MKTPQNREEISIFTKDSFPDFNFILFDKLLKSIQKWEELSSDINALLGILANVENYTIAFIEYFLANHLHQRFSLIKDLKH